MNKDTKNKILQAIKKTGFITEYSASKILNENGWFIINNRYYLDDISGIPREIDIIAYKTTKIKELFIYTVIVISCKKSEENYWLFLTKNLNKSDPNIIYENLDNWTNEKLLDSIDSKSIIENKVNIDIASKEFIKDIFLIKNNIFAMQEISKSNFSLKNDQNIYNSIVSMIKAKEFEIESLGNRKKNKSVYNFFTVSVQDLSMIEFSPEDLNSELNEILHIKYLNRFIINQKDKFHLIHFIHIDYLRSFLEKFNLFHEYLVTEYIEHLQLIKNKFYSSPRIYNCYLEEVRKEISFDIYLELKYTAKLIEEDIIDISFGNLYQENSLIIFLGFDNKYAIDFCNNSIKIKNKVNTILEKYYYFKINFKFSGIDDFPF